MPFGVDDIAAATAAYETATAAWGAYASIRDKIAGVKSDAQQANENAQHAWDAANQAHTAADNAAAAAQGAATAADINNIPGMVWDFKILTDIYNGGVGATALQIAQMTFDFLYYFQGNAPDRTGNPYLSITHNVDALFNAVEQAVVAALDANNQAYSVKQLLSSAIGGLTRYSLDASGLASFADDKQAGRVQGDGLIVLYSPPDSDGQQLPVLNPELLTFSSPSGDTVYSILAGIADALYSSSLYSLRGG